MTLLYKLFKDIFGTASFILYILSWIFLSLSLIMFVWSIFIMNHELTKLSEGLFVFSLLTWLILSTYIEYL